MPHLRDINPKRQLRLRKRRDRNTSRESREIEIGIEFRAIKTPSGALGRILDICNRDRRVRETGLNPKGHARGTLECGAHADTVGDDGAEAEDAGYGDACAGDGGREEFFGFRQRLWANRSSDRCRQVHFSCNTLRGAGKGEVLETEVLDGEVACDLEATGHETVQAAQAESEHVCQLVNTPSGGRVATNNVVDTISVLTPGVPTLTGKLTDLLKSASPLSMKLPTSPAASTTSPAAWTMSLPIFPMESNRPRRRVAFWDMMALPKSRSYVPATSDHGAAWAVRKVVRLFWSSRISVILDSWIRTTLYRSVILELTGTADARLEDHSHHD